MRQETQELQMAWLRCRGNKEVYTQALQICRNEVARLLLACERADALGDRPRPNLSDLISATKRYRKCAEQDLEPSISVFNSSKLAHEDWLRNREEAIDWLDSAITTWVKSFGSLTAW